MSADNNQDWIDHLSRAAGSVGMNSVRVRWKLIKWRDRWQAMRARTDLRTKQVRYAHHICHACGSIQDRSHKVCDTCGARLLPRALELLRRCGLFVPGAVTPTSLIISVILFQYYRAATFGGGDPLHLNAGALIHFGANYPPAVWEGDWWRIATCVLLHADVIHILFNLLALKQIGPAVEEVFGKGRTLFYFMVTGILAGIGSAAIRSDGIGIGASGAIMGLVGLAAGWGQRDGGLAGRTVRDSMLQWGLYTLVFGYLVGADNAAHLIGVVSGFALGVLVRPLRDKRLSPYVVVIESTLGIILFISTAALTNFPPKSVLDVTIATVQGAMVTACGENSGIPENPAELPHFSGDCRTVTAKLENNFGIAVVLTGSPENGTAYLTVRVTHPPMHNPEHNETTTVYEWETSMKVGVPAYTGWRFDHPWELVPGEWTIQLLAEDETTVLAEKTFRVEE